MNDFSIEQIESIEMPAQGTNEWHDLRRVYFCASDASAMLGLSPYKSRQEYLKEKATGIIQETEGYQQQIFDEGHRVEADARLIIEKKLDEDLFPEVFTGTVEGMKLLASLDGVDLMHTMNWEHKLWNQQFIDSCNTKGLQVPDAINVPEHIWPQLEQQLLLTGAKKTILTFSDGTEDNMLNIEYTSIPERCERLIEGWKQFTEDLEQFNLESEPERIEIQARKNLPALSVKVQGHVISTNLKEFESEANAILMTINTDLETDLDFAQAENDVKYIHEVEKKLDACEEAILGQTSSIDDALKTIGHIRESYRQKRLFLQKTIAPAKLQKKREIVDQAQQEIIDFRNTTNRNGACGKGTIIISNFEIQNMFSGNVKGLKTLTSVKRACEKTALELKFLINTEARQLLEATETYEKLVPELYRGLFPDLNNVLHSDNMEAICRDRIAQQQAKEERAKKQEEERQAKEKQESELHESMAEQTSAWIKEDMQLPAYGEQEREDQSPSEIIRRIYKTINDLESSEDRIKKFLNYVGYRGRKVQQAREILISYEEYLKHRE